MSLILLMTHLFTSTKWHFIPLVPPFNFLNEHCCSWLLAMSVWHNEHLFSILDRAQRRGSQTWWFSTEAMVFQKLQKFQYLHIPEKHMLQVDWDKNEKSVCASLCLCVRACLCGSVCLCGAITRTKYICIHGFLTCHIFYEEQHSFSNDAWCEILS